MATWQYLVTFEAKEDRKFYFILSLPDIPKVGTSLQSFASPASLQDGNSVTRKIKKYKPSQSFIGQGEVQIPKVAQENFLDFEIHEDQIVLVSLLGEFTIITSKDTKDVSIEDVQKYIFGYTIGNNLSAYMFQAPTSSGRQYTYTKAFDRAALLAPIIVNPAYYSSVAEKQLKTTINGKVVQDSPVDLIWGPEKLVSFLSQGRTLPAGTAIMTGTLSGIGYFQTPKYSLKDGDVVEITIEGIGKLSNTIKTNKIEARHLSV